MECSRPSHLPALATTALLAACLAVPVAAQADVGTSMSGGRGGYLGLNLGSSGYRLPCSAASLTCEFRDDAVNLYAGGPGAGFWGGETALLEMGQPDRGGGRTRPRGLSLSLVGRAPVWQSLGVFGRLGATYGRADTSVQVGREMPAGGDSGFGLSYGAGLSWDFTSRLSAVFEWDSRDLRFPGGGREPVRATSLGLQYRY